MFTSAMVLRMIKERIHDTFFDYYFIHIHIIHNIQNWGRLLG